MRSTLKRPPEPLASQITNYFYTCFKNTVNKKLFTI